MNFSHGEYEYHQSVIDNTRKMVAGERAPVALRENSNFLTFYLSHARGTPRRDCA